MANTTKHYEFIQPSLLVPPLKRDLNMRALESLQARNNDLDIAKVVIYDFDNVDKTALPHLAEQYGLLGDAGWELADTEAKQRALLKVAIPMRKKRGTPFAVRRVLEALGINMTIVEWFEKSPMGKPYTFEAISYINDQPNGAPVITPERFDLIFRCVNYWKNVRSGFGLKLGAGFICDPITLWGAAVIRTRVDMVGEFIFEPTGNNTMGLWGAMIPQTHVNLTGVL